MKLNKFFKLFQRNERGVTALEYAILAAVIVAAVAGLSATITGIYTTTFSHLSTKITTAIGS